MSKRILIIAGGTGGHVMPALAVAVALRELGYQVEWMGTANGMEARLVPLENIKIHMIDIHSLRGRGWKRILSAPFVLLKALFQSVKIIYRYQPIVVLSMGGYVSGPGSIAAYLMRRSLVIHEQNALPGLTNRLLAPLATGIITAFPEVFLSYKKKVHYFGNPIRENIYDSYKKKSDNTYKSDKTDIIKILVVGGSLGADFLNQLMPEVLLQVQDQVEIWHQTGAKGFIQTKARYEALGLLESPELKINIVDFIVDMGAAYAWADCVICRAGALTLSEIMLSGVASVLVPLPSAADDHQTHNAKPLYEKGGAIVISQNSLSVEKMVALLKDFIAKPEALIVMGKKARELATPNATIDVVNYLRGFLDASN